MRFSSGTIATSPISSQLIDFLHTIPTNLDEFNIDEMDEFIVVIGNDLTKTISSFNELFDSLILMSNLFSEYDFLDPDAVLVNFPFMKFADPEENQNNMKMILEFLYSKIDTPFAGSLLYDMFHSDLFEFVEDEQILELLEEIKHQIPSSDDY